MNTPTERTLGLIKKRNISSEEAEKILNPLSPFLKTLESNPSHTQISELLKQAKNEEDPDFKIAALQANKIFLSIVKRGGTTPSFKERHEKILAELAKAPTTNLERGNLQLPAGSSDQEVQQIHTGPVITRFPPEPSGFLHIGHAKAALLNEYFPRKQGGILILRFDDTNPAKESLEYEEAIKKDLETMNIKFDKVSHTSEFFPILHEYCEKMIKSGNAYCDNTELEQMRMERDAGIKSKNRDNTIDENLEIFKNKTNGYCVRARISVDNKNKAMRDPVIYRAVKVPADDKTQETTTWFPTYDFACPIVDSLEGITHTLRTSEYRDRNSVYRWMCDALNLRCPHIVDFARMNFEDTLLSKRKLLKIIESHNLTWDDPRMPTLRGIFRRGLQVEALREYILMQGISTKIATISWDKLFALNKKLLESSDRYFAVCDPWKIEIQNHEALVKEEPLNRKNPDGLKKKVHFDKEIFVSRSDIENLKEGDTFALMYFSVVEIVESNENGLIVKKVDAEIKNEKVKIGWVGKTDVRILNFVEYGPLIVNDEFNVGSKAVREYYGESAMDGIRVGQVVQIERDGFYCFDGGNDFNLVPFTKQARKK